MIGRNCNANAAPMTTPLPVSDSSSQVSATICIQLPLTETSCPAKKRR